MPNYNHVTLMGHLTRTPEVHRTPSGTSVADIGIAVSRKYKQKDEWVEETAFVDCTAWGRRAEVITEHLGKGDPIFITGYLKLDQWTDSDSGKNRSKLRVTITDFQFCGRKGEGGGVKKEVDEADVPF